MIELFIAFMMLCFIVVVMWFKNASLQHQNDSLLSSLTIDASRHPSKEDVTDAWNAGSQYICRLTDGRIYITCPKQYFTETEFRSTAKYYLKILDDIARDHAMQTDDASTT